MCSNAGSGYGDSCGCSVHGDMLSFGSKNKQKCPRVPKRGPGVAELEKILREQEMDKVQGFCSSSMVPKCSNNSTCDSSSVKSHPFSSPPPPLPPPSQLTLSTPPSTRSTSLPVSIGFSQYPYVPLAPTFEHLNPTSPTTSDIYGNGAAPNSALPMARGDRSGGSSGVSATAGGKGLAFPEQPYFHLTPNKSKASTESLLMESGNSPCANLSHESYRCWPNTPLPQKRNCQYPSPVMNPYLVSGTQASSTSSGVRMYSHLEPPSNQTGYNYSSMLTEELKGTGVKRPCHFSSLKPSESPHFRFPAISDHVISKPELQTSHSNDNKNIVSTNTSITRDANWYSPLELNPRNYHFQPYGCGTPTTSSPSLRTLEGEMICQYKANPDYHDKRIEEWSNQRPEVESVGPSHKPYYCFLQEKNQKGMNEKAVEGSDDKRDSESDNTIDLSLKL